MMNIFDRYYKKYDAWYEKNKFVYLSELEALQKVIPKEGKGLEIGVGTGRFAVPLKIATGIDSSRNMLTIARRRGLNVRWGFGEDLPFWNETFDYIAIIITICFVKNPTKILEEAKRVLKDKGKIILGIIDKDSFLGKLYQKKKSLFYNKANFYSVKNLVTLLKAVGFKKFTYYQTIFHFPKKIHSIEKPKKGFGKGSFIVISGKK